MGTRRKTPPQFLRRQQTRKQWLRNGEAQIAASYVRALCIWLTVSNPVGVASLPLSLLSDSVGAVSLKWVI